MACGEIIATWLREHGYAGLCNPEQECGCGLDDLIPCGEYFGDCEPAYLRTATEEEKAEYGYDEIYSVTPPDSTKEE